MKGRGGERIDRKNASTQEIHEDFPVGSKRRSLLGLSNV